MDGGLSTSTAPQYQSDGINARCCCCSGSGSSAGYGADRGSRALGSGWPSPALLPLAVPVRCSNKCLSGQRGAGGGADRTSECPSAANVPWGWPVPNYGTAVNGRRRANARAAMGRSPERWLHAERKCQKMATLEAPGR